jgi:HEAT repeat protein
MMVAMKGWGEPLWQLLPAVRRDERSRAVFFTGLFTLISAAQTLGLAGSEALLLAELGAGWLPQTFIAASLLTVLGSMIYATRVGENRNDDLFVRMLAAAAALLGVAALAATAGSVFVLVALFCFFYLTQAVFLNHFWTFSGDYFDTLTSKRLFPVFTVGASLGGLAGGAAAVGLTRIAGPASLIAGWAALLAAAALLLRLGRRPLRRWGPLELEESDETSVEGMRGAVRYLRGSTLGTWLVVSSLGMVLAIFIAQYIYSDIFARAFPDPSSLAVFFGIYLAATNAVEIALELFVMPWLIRRFGVPTAHLVHPTLTLLSFGGLALHHGLVTGIGARMNRELVENAIAQPIRTLVYNALPSRFRGRIRAFLEGVVVYAGMSAAGLVLLVSPDPEPLWLCAGGGAAAAVYLVANLRARRAYLRTLLAGIRAGRLDLAEVDEEIGDWEAARLAELCEQMLAGEAGRPSRSLRQLVATLSQRGLVDPLVRGAAHSSPPIRQLCVEALAGSNEQSALPLLLEALEDPDGAVRLSALRGLAETESGTPAFEAQLEALLEDPDPRVRAEAAAHCESAGLLVLREMLHSPRRDEAIAAFRSAPPELRGELLERVRDEEDPTLRAAGLAAAVALAGDAPLPATLGIAALDSPHAQVRRVAVPILDRARDADTLAPLTRALTDVAGAVRTPAAMALAARGEAGIEICLPLLRDDRERVVLGALRAIALSDSARGRAILADELRHRVRQLWYRVLAHRKLPSADAPVTRFLHVAWGDAIMRSHRLAFRTLELLENERIIRKVERALRFGTARARGDALEVLSNLGDRESAQLLVALHESGPLEERLASLRGVVSPAPDWATVLDASRRSDVPWIRLASAALRGELDRSADMDAVERLLALKQVPLFANLTLEQLEAVDQRTRESVFVPGEVIVRQGEAGGELYLLLHGVVEVFLNHGTPEQELRRVMEAVAYFGEMAALVDEPRSATVVARERSQLLALDGGSLKELIHQMPEIAFEIFRVLNARVRSAERDLLERAADRQG